MVTGGLHSLPRLITCDESGTRAVHLPMGATTKKTIRSSCPACRLRVVQDRNGTITSGRPCWSTGESVHHGNPGCCLVCSAGSAVFFAEEHDLIRLPYMRFEPRCCTETIQGCRRFHQIPSPATRAPDGEARTPMHPVGYGYVAFPPSRVIVYESVGHKRAALDHERCERSLAADAATARQRARTADNFPPTTSPGIPTTNAYCYRWGSNKLLFRSIRAAIAHPNRLLTCSMIQMSRPVSTAIWRAEAKNGMFFASPFPSFSLAQTCGHRRHIPTSCRVRRENPLSSII